MHTRFFFDEPTYLNLEYNNGLCAKPDNTTSCLSDTLKEVKYSSVIHIRFNGTYFYNNDNLAKCISALTSLFMLQKIQIENLTLDSEAVNSLTQYIQSQDAHHLSTIDLHFVSINASSKEINVLANALSQQTNIHLICIDNIEIDKSKINKSLSRLAVSNVDKYIEKIKTIMHV